LKGMSTMGRGLILGLALILAVPLFGDSPASAQTVLTGTLHATVADDFATGTARTTYSVQTEKGTVPVLPTMLSEARSGSPVRISGNKVGGYLVGRVEGQALSNPNSPAGPHTVAVVLVRFEEEGEEEPPSAEFMRERVWTAADSAASFYNIDTAGRLTLTSIKDPEGDVFGPYTVVSRPESATHECTFSGQMMTEEVDGQAAAEGISLSEYDNVLYVVPGTSCGTFANVAGFAELGGRRAVIYSWPLTDYRDPHTFSRTIDHELGHNFGLHHAHFLFCQDSEGYAVPFSDNCRVEEYGDSYDIMGDGYAYHDWYLHDLGVLEPGSVITSTESGVYTISAGFHGDSTPILLRVPSRWDSLGTPTEWDDVEYRDMINPFEQHFYTDRGVLIRSSPDGIGESSLWYCAEKQGLSEGLCVLKPGSTFTDGHLELTTVSVGEGKATVRVTLPLHLDTEPPSKPGVPTAAFGAPGVELSWTPSSDHNGVARYVVYRDGEEIGTSADPSFVDESAYPLGQGRHVYLVFAEDEANNRSESSRVVVWVPDRLPPSRPGTAAATVLETGVELEWEPSWDLRADGSSTEINRYFVYRDGVEIGEESAPRFFDAGVAPGTHSYVIYGEDEAGNRSAASPEVAVTVPSPSAPTAPGEAAPGVSAGAGEGPASSAPAKTKLSISVHSHRPRGLIVLAEARGGPAVQRLELWIDSKRVAVAGGPSLRYVWKTGGRKDLHRLEAKAMTIDGAATIAKKVLRAAGPR